MIRKAWLYTLLLLSGMNAYAQSCCCTSVGSNWSILPSLDKQLIGVRYTYRQSYSVYPESLNPELSGKVTDEQLHSAEVFGRFKVHERLALSAYIPVSLIQQTSGVDKNTSAGLGDMTLLLQYYAINPLKCTGKASKHQLRLGAGVKLPSGQFKKQPNEMFATNLQLGTGSIDFLLNAMYTYRYKKFGINLIASDKINTVNNAGFRFGDKLQATGTAFYVADLKEVSLITSLGASFEHVFYSRKSKNILRYTGGDFVTAVAGLDIYYKHFAFTSSINPVLMNRLNWSGELRHRFSIETGIYYNF